MEKAYLCSYLDDNPLFKGVVYGGVIYKFSQNGVFYEKSPFRGVSGPLVEIDLISVLYYQRGIEIAFLVKNIYKKSLTRVSLSDIVGKIHSHPELLTICRKEGEISGENYKQYIYGFRQGGLTLDWVSDNLIK